MCPERNVNFQQLKIIREAARQDYNLTEVANILYTSQSGVSRHIRELEDELGIEIFIRRGKRLLGMTEPGKALLVIAERILNEASNVRRLADLFTNDTSGVLTIATTHTQARYSLPAVIKDFRELFPEVTQLSTRHSATSGKPVYSRAFVVKSDNQSPPHLAPSPDA
jgi:LysR family transcriptional regulator, cys regulon transcriptional activator